MPPSRFVAMMVEFAMMRSAKRYGEFVTDFAAHGTRLSEADVVRIGWSGAANEARLGGDVAQVVLVTHPARLGESKRALVDAAIR